MPITDVTLDVQSRFDSNNYDLSPFDGCGIGSVTLKHPVCEITADSPITIYMTPKIHPTKPQFSMSVPMVLADHRVNKVQRFERISFSKNITFDGFFPVQVPDFATNLSIADPQGLARNCFDQIIDDKNDVIEEFEFDSNVRNLMGAAVSISNVIRGKIRGSYKTIGNKVFGCAYSQSENPMFIDFSPREVDYVHQVMDFSAPPALKSFVKKTSAYGWANKFAAYNVYGRPKTAALSWNVRLENLDIYSLPQPSPVAYSGFTVTESLNSLVVDNVGLHGFLRAGLELRAPAAVHISGLRVSNSLNGLYRNGTTGPITYGATSVFENVKNAGMTNNYTLSNPMPIDWDAMIFSAKQEAATKYGQVINFPI